MRSPRRGGHHHERSEDTPHLRRKRGPARRRVVHIHRQLKSVAVGIPRPTALAEHERIQVGGSDLCPLGHRRRDHRVRRLVVKHDVVVEPGGVEAFGGCVARGAVGGDGRDRRCLDPQQLRVRVLPLDRDEAIGDIGEELGVLLNSDALGVEAEVVEAELKGDDVIREVPPASFASRQRNLQKKV